MVDVGSRIRLVCACSRRCGAVQHDAAVDLALPGWVLGDIGHPQAVWLGRGEVAAHEIKLIFPSFALLGNSRVGRPRIPSRRMTTST